jgi:hypothetical protein
LATRHREKENNLKNAAIFLQLAGTYCVKMVILEQKIPQNLATLAHSFLTKLLCMNQAGFCFLVTT